MRSDWAKSSGKVYCQRVQGLGSLSQRDQGLGSLSQRVQGLGSLSQRVQGFRVDYGRKLEVFNLATVFCSRNACFL